MSATDGPAIRPIYEEAAQVMQGVRSALEAELWASELLGAVRLGLGQAEPEQADAVSVAFAAMIGDEAERAADADGLAILRALAAVVPDATPETGPKAEPAAESVRTRLAEAAARLAASGVPDQAWAATIGRPVIGTCLRQGDIEGRQESILVCARYGTTEHALVVLVDHQLGGGVKDCWVAADAAEVVSRFHQGGQDAGMTSGPLTWPQTRELLGKAVAQPDCAEQPDQIQDTAAHRALLLSRLALGDDTPATPAR